MNILVTGGASGLGATIVKKLASNSNNTVFFTYSASVEAAKDLELLYANTQAFHCNFNDEASIETLLDQLTVLNIQVLINNANGSIHKEHFQKTDYHVFEDSFKHNVMPALRITQKAIGIFKKNRFGKIINIISSAVINKPPVGWSEYVANKAYLLAMNKSWATENSRFNVTSNCISPSFMLTNLTKDTDERIIQQIVDGHPLKKLLTVEEVADTVAFLCNASQHINGVNIIMNAGTDLI